MRPALIAAFAVALAGCASLPTADDVPLPTPPFALDCSLAHGPWSDLCIALASPNPSPSKAEVDLVVNPKDPLNIVVASKDLDRRASDTCWSVAQVTQDGGRSWTTVYVGGDKANRHPLLAPYQTVTDPIMAFDADGTLYYVLEAYDTKGRQLDGLWSNVPGLPVAGTFDGGGSAMFLARSRDGGLTFDRIVPVAQGQADLVFHDYIRMAVSPTTGAVHAVWTGIGKYSYTPWIGSTRDGGETAESRAIAAPDAPTSTYFVGGFSITPDGVLWATITKGGNFFAGRLTDVFLMRSTDDGRTWEEVGYAFSFLPTPRQMPGREYRTAGILDLAADTSDGPNAGRLYASYVDYTSRKATQMTRFSDDGVTWSDPVAAGEGAGHEFFQRPAVGADGTLFILYATEGLSGPGLLDQVLAFSRDGGRTFDHLRLTPSGFDGNRGLHQDGFPFIGDYNGLQVGPDGAVWAGWADTRTGVAEIAVARVLPAGSAT